MRKPININNIGNNKEYEKLRTENKKLKEEFDKYKESLLSQNEKLKKENSDLKQILLHKTNTNLNAYQNKDTYISLLEKQKDFLISILITLINSISKNKINKEMIIFQLEKNIGKEKEKEKFINDFLNLINDNKINFINNTNNKTINLRYNNYINNNAKNNNVFVKNNFNFQILSNKVNKVIFKSNKSNNSYYTNGNEKLKEKKELELLKKINEMLNIIKKKKDALKNRKNNLSFRARNNKENKDGK